MAKLLQELFSSIKFAMRRQKVSMPAVCCAQPVQAGHAEPLLCRKTSLSPTARSMVGAAVSEHGLPPLGASGCLVLFKR